MKDIAVIIPVYNGEKTLVSCVESVLSAGKRISEIIIVDDGSTDKTLETAYCLSEKENRITVIHTENHGCYAARITGIKASTSPYIAFADVDDRFCSGALDLLAELIEKYDADVAMGSYREVASPEDSIQNCEAPEIRNVPAEIMWKRIMKWKMQEFVCYVWNKIYKREALMNLVNAGGVNQGEDVLITCQAFINIEKIIETSAPVYLYYCNPESLTRSAFGDGDIGLIRVWDIIVEMMRAKRPDLLAMAQFNRWRTDFTLITRLILANDKKLDMKYADELDSWRKSLKEHWRGLISPHAMPRNRELLVIGLRFFFTPTKKLIRLGRKLTGKMTSFLL